MTIEVPHFFAFLAGIFLGTILLASNYYTLNETQWRCVEYKVVTRSLDDGAFSVGRYCNLYGRNEQ